MTETKKRKIIAIVGPTASGKTAIGVKLAKEFNGEIVSADSRQIFRGLDLGTGKDLSEYNGVKYHLIDICDPEDEFNLFKYLELARLVIEDIFSRGKVPIIVGGTGLYVQALVEGFELKPMDVISTPQLCLRAEKSSNKRSLHVGRDDTGGRGNNERGREQLNNLTIEQLQRILKDLKEQSFEKLVDKQNPHRLIRAIERAQSGEEMIKIKPDFEVLQIGLEWPREILNERIDRRVDERFKQGMLSEAEGLVEAGIDINWLVGLGLEYRIIGLYLLIQNLKFKIQNDNEKLKINKLIVNCKLKIENFESFNAMKQTLKVRSHQYAKRQMTWFKRFSEIVWEIDYEKIAQLVKSFLNK